MTLTLAQRYSAAVDCVYIDLTQKQIGEKYGIAQSDVSLLLRPAARAAKHARQRRDYRADLTVSRLRQSEKHREFRAKRSRFELAIFDSKTNAMKGGYAPINATPEKIQSLLIEQNFQCKICKAVDGRTRSTRLRPDHCHKTGTFRGWLCHRCNTGIHVVEDYPHATAEYLSGV